MRHSFSLIAIIAVLAGVVMAQDKLQGLKKKTLKDQASVKKVKKPQASKEKNLKSKKVDEHDRFVMHEWGTFTSFSGSDGVKLEFRPLIDSDLPPFVLNRGTQSGIPRPPSKVLLPGLQRMETPVTYFYTNREREIEARVAFPQGLLTEFYPPVKTMLPAFHWKKAAPIANSLLDWGKFWLIPADRFKAHVDNPLLAKQLQSELIAKMLPGEDQVDHYTYARETDSALVYMQREKNKKLPLTPNGSFFEKFLFYRGIGNFELPLTLEARAGNQFILTNEGENPISEMFLVSVQNKQIRFLHFDKLDQSKKLVLAQPDQVSSLDELSSAVAESLVAEGLYEKEAIAMVNTWKSSWFGEEGTRLFYMLPEQVTDELLPLEIKPTPDETVRVMVGRLEIMTPEDEKRITELVAQSAVERAANRKKKKRDAYKFPQAIQKMGRLAEPALVRVKNITDKSTVRHEAVLLLHELQVIQKALEAALSARTAAASK